MQGILQLVEAVTGTFTRGIWILVAGGVAVVAIISLTVGFAAPAVVDKVGERAERISEQAIEAAREESRAHQLAQDGWGFSDTTDSSAGTDAADFEDDSSGTHDDDWGAPSE